ncbi:MAG: M56 family metallopeptidase, partial [Candidatus Hydrogenedentota bacterium]
MLNAFIQFLSESPLFLQRLIFISLEVVALVLLLECVVALRLIRSPRLIGLLWVVVFLKCTVGLLVPSTIQIPVSEVPTVIVDSEFLDDNVEAVDRPIVPIKTPEDLGVTQVMPQLSTAPANLASALTVDRDSQKLGISYADVVLLLWLSGVACFALRLFVEIIRLRRIARDSHDADKDLMGIMIEEADSLGLALRPRIKINDSLDSPGLAGFLIPSLYIPTLLCPATESTLRWVIRHELTHWKHGDLYVNTLRQLAVSIFFFHPAVWWASRRWLDYAEFAVDRAVLHTTSDADDYASNLVGVAEMSKKLASNPLKLNAVFAWKHQLGRRIDRLLNIHILLPRTPARISLLFCAMLLVLGVGSTLGLDFRLPPIVEANAAESQDDPETIQVLDHVLGDGTQVINEYRVPPARTLVFPENVSMGQLRVGREQLNAQGTIHIEKGERVSFRLQDQGVPYLYLFADFPPFAFQDMTLSSTAITDDDLKYIAHMSGLNQLSLTRSAIG